MESSRPINAIDIISAPVFVVTMLAEARALRKVPELREMGDLHHWTKEELSDTSLPPDPLVPVGYERRDTVASLTMLAGNIAVNLAAAAALGRVHRFLYRNRVANVGGGRGSFLKAMIMWDFLYYWNHRWMHQHRILWANHVTHHSSEHYNLSTALRQPWSGFLLSWVFMPLPALGMLLHHAARAGQLNLLYQYWIHTEMIDRLPKPIEAVFNTPSHHRGHHGANPQYLDVNHGGILIIWDRLFGTFEPEVRRVKYGLTENINTFNPALIGYHEFIAMFGDVRRATGWRNKLGHIFRRPGWQPDPPTAPDVAHQVPLDPAV